MYKVLLVDDEILVRDAIRENIHWENLGYQLVKDCANGKEAKEYVEEHSIDVVLTDICMPFMDGMELSAYLYEHHPQVSIIIFSGFEEFEYAKKAIKYKVAEYILKPVTAKELSDVLLRVKEKLDQRQQEEKKLDQLNKGYASYKKNKAVIDSKLLSRLVLGTLDIGQNLSELAAMGVSLHAANYRVAIVGIDLYAYLFEVDQALKKQSALMTFAVQNICNEIIHSYGAGMAFQDGDNRVCLLLQTNHKKGTPLLLTKMIQQIQESVASLMKLNVSCGIGIYVKELTKLSDSYKTATEALQYHYLFGDRLVLDMEEVKDRLNKEISIEKELEALSVEIKAGNREQASEEFSRIEEKIKEGYSGKYRTCMYLQQMIRRIYEVLVDLNGEKKAYESKRDEVLSKIAECSTFEEMKKLVGSYMELVMGELSEIKCSSAKRQASMAVDYIKKNYANPELSLNLVCSYLNVSTSHFSTIFKEATGATFMEVLIGIRMQKAKELLLQTTLKNYEIAERVGFSDPHYFSIVFKKMTGKTPQKYAKGKR